MLFRQDLARRPGIQSVDGFPPRQFWRSRDSNAIRYTPEIGFQVFKAYEGVRYDMAIDAVILKSPVFSFAHHAFQHAPETGYCSIGRLLPPLLLFAQLEIRKRNCLFIRMPLRREFESAIPEFCRNHLFDFCSCQMCPAVNLGMLRDIFSPRNVAVAKARAQYLHNRAASGLFGAKIDEVMSEGDDHRGRIERAPQMPMSGRT